MEPDGVQQGCSQRCSSHRLRAGTLSRTVYVGAVDIGIPLADPGRNYIFVYDGATERAFVHPSEKAEGFLYALDTP